VGSGGVSAKTRRSPSRATSGALVTTSQPVGAVTVKRIRALRSGWSKQANTLCASTGASWVHR
jgi:hypothetical protein